MKLGNETTHQECEPAVKLVQSTKNIPIKLSFEIKKTSGKGLKNSKIKQGINFSHRLRNISALGY